MHYLTANEFCDSIDTDDFDIQTGASYPRSFPLIVHISN